MPDRSIEDAMGEVLRRDALGLVRPLWEDLSEDSKAHYCDRAAWVINRLDSLGLTVTWKDEG